jgi:hypothetical protein
MTDISRLRDKCRRNPSATNTHRYRHSVCWRLWQRQPNQGTRCPKTSYHSPGNPHSVIRVDSTEQNTAHGERVAARLPVLRCTYRDTNTRTADILLTANSARCSCTMFLKYPSHFNAFCPYNYPILFKYETCLFTTLYMQHSNTTVRLASPTPVHRHYNRTDFPQHHGAEPIFRK